MSRLRVAASLALAASVVGACQFHSEEGPRGCAEISQGPDLNGLGGAPESVAKVEAMMDYGAIAGSSMFELTTKCLQIATSLGVGQEAIDRAIGSPGREAELSATCALAADAVTRARGADVIVAKQDEIRCDVPTALSTACQRRCARDAECLFACDAAARAQADCSTPSVTSQGASSADLANVISGHFPAILTLRARLAYLADDAAPLSVIMNGVDDIIGPCVPVARDRMREASTHVTSSRAAIDAVLSSAGYP